MTVRVLKATLTHARLREVLSYDSETGVFRWLVNPQAHAGRNLVGSEAGARTHGYIKISIDGRRYYAHRVAVFWMTGEWPSGVVDHRNGLNNAWLNLRPATRSQNNSNSAVRSNNRSGFKGVSLTKQGRYWAQIRHAGSNLYLGTFKTAELAHAAYIAASIRLHGEFARAA